MSILSSMSLWQSIPAEEEPLLQSPPYYLAGAQLLTAQPNTCTPSGTYSSSATGMADSSQGQANGHSEANGTAPTAAGFSLTFGAAKGRGGQPHRTLKPASKQAKPEAANGFGVEDQSRAGPRIIPKQADTFATERQRAPRFLPTAGQDPANGLSFEQADAEQDR